MLHSNSSSQETTAANALCGYLLCIPDGNLLGSGSLVSHPTTSVPVSSPSIEGRAMEQSQANYILSRALKEETGFRVL